MRCCHALELTVSFQVRAGDLTYGESRLESCYGLRIDQVLGKLTVEYTDRLARRAQSHPEHTFLRDTG